MSAQYREGGKKFYTKYLTNDSTLPSCPGSCSCDFGTRTEYDAEQMEWAMTGEFPELKLVRKISGWKG